MSNEQPNLTEYFGDVIIPRAWKYKGVNHLSETDDEDHQTFVSLGLVFIDTTKNIDIKLTFTLDAERYYLTEKDKSGRYRTKCDFMRKEISQFNQFITSNY